MLWRKSGLKVEMDCDSAGKISKNETKLKIAENKNTRNSRKDCFKKTFSPK